MFSNTVHARLVIVGIAVLALTACELGALGKTGKFNFRDKTPSPSTSRSELRPLALGARMRLEISGADRVVEVKSSDEDILEILDFGDDFVEVRGGRPGVAVIEVRDFAENEDAIDVEVAEIHSGAVKLLPWDPVFSLPEDLWTDGAVLLPGAPVRVFVELRSADGELLTGSGAAQWQITQGNPAMVSAEQGDFATLKAMTDVTGAVDIRYGEWASVRLEVVQPEAIAQVGLYSQSQDVGANAGESLTLDSNMSHLMHVTAFTEDGRYVIGSGSDAVDPSADAAAPFTITLDAAAATDEDSQDLARILGNGRAFYLKTQGLGQDALTVSWQGQQYDFEIVVR
jgi:hypothetical protein